MTLNGVSTVQGLPKVFYVPPIISGTGKLLAENWLKC